MTLIVASAEARLGGGRWGKSSDNCCGQSSGGNLIVIIGHGRDEEQKDVGGEEKLG